MANGENRRSNGPRFFQVLDCDRCSGISVRNEYFAFEPIWQPGNDSVCLYHLARDNVLHSERNIGSRLCVPSFHSLLEWARSSGSAG